VFHAIADVIFDSDHATELMATLRQSDIQLLSKLPPERLYREMGKLEASMNRAPAAPSGPARTPISQAPAPIKPVGTSASNSVADDASGDMDLDEFVRVGNVAEAKRLKYRR